MADKEAGDERRAVGGGGWRVRDNNSIRVGEMRMFDAMSFHNPLIR